MKNDETDQGFKPDRGMTRRRFIKSIGAGAAVVSATGGLSAWAPAQARLLEPGQLHEIFLTINGQSHQLLVEARWSLLFVLREKLGLTGTKVGCDRGECGACTVLINGVPRYACLTLAIEAEGAAVTTLEGLMDGEKLGPVQEAFLENDAFQCGYCTSGQIMAAEGLLRSSPAPSRSDIRLAMSGNLCRCGAYTHIFQAVEAAAKSRGRK